MGSAALTTTTQLLAGATPEDALKAAFISDIATSVGGTVTTGVTEATGSTIAGSAAGSAAKGYVSSGGDANATLLSAVAGASATAVSDFSGSTVAGKAVGAVVAAGGVNADALIKFTASVAPEIRSATGLDAATTGTTSTKLKQDISATDAANIVASVSEQSGDSPDVTQQKILNVIGGKTAGTDVAFLPAAIYGGIALAPEITAGAAAASAAITGGIGYLMSLVGTGEALPASEQEKNIGKAIIELIRANPTSNAAEVTAEVQKLFPQVTEQQIQVLQQNQNNPTLMANLPQEIVITAPRPEKTDAGGGGGGGQTGGGTPFNAIVMSVDPATKTAKVVNSGGQVSNVTTSGDTKVGQAVSVAGGTISGSAGAQPAAGSGIKTGSAGAGPTGKTGAAGDVVAGAADAGTFLSGTPGGGPGTAGPGGGGPDGGGPGDGGPGDGTVGTGGTGGGDGTGVGTGKGTGTGAGTGTGGGTGSGEGDGTGDGTGGGQGGGSGDGTGTGTGTGPGTGVGDPGKVTSPTITVVAPKKVTPKTALPTITGFGRSPLEQALTAFRPAGEIEGESTGKPRENVWNEASLRLKDALGL
jgi:hypothetical protein